MADGHRDQQRRLRGTDATRVPSGNLGIGLANAGLRRRCRYRRPNRNATATASKTLRWADIVSGSKQIDVDGTFEYSPEVEVSLELPAGYVLEDAYPNPLRAGGAATVRYAVARSQAVEAVLYTALGRPVRVLYAGHVEGDRMHRLDVSAQGLASGLYVVRLQGESFTGETSLMVVR